MILYFIHTPRTGGLSVQQYMGQGKKKGLFNISCNGHARYSEKHHTQLKNQAAETSEKVIAFTILRDPVELAASLYSYIRMCNANSHRGYLETQKWNFSQWIVESNQHKNFYTRFLNWHTPAPKELHPPVQGAVDTLKQFNYIFDTSTLTQGFNTMLKK